MVPPSTDNNRDQPTEPPSAADAAQQIVIWGTDVNVTQCKDKFRQFILRSGFLGVNAMVSICQYIDLKKP